MDCERCGAGVAGIRPCEVCLAPSHQLQAFLAEPLCQVFHRPIGESAQPRHLGRMHELRCGELAVLAEAGATAEATGLPCGCFWTEGHFAGYCRGKSACTWAPCSPLLSVVTAACRGSRQGIYSVSAAPLHQITSCGV